MARRLPGGGWRGGRGIGRQGAGCRVHIPDAEEGIANIHPHRGDIPQRGGVQGASRDAALPQVQGWDAAHDQVARARAYASVGRERHENDFQKEKIVGERTSQ